MENYNGNFYYNSYGNDNDSNEYLTLKHCGALLIREVEPEKKEEEYLTLKHCGALLIRNEKSNKNKTEEKPLKPSKGNKKTISFESKVKMFEPKTKTFTTYVPEKKGTREDKKHMEKPKISNTLLENSKQKNYEDNDFDKKNELPRRSAIIQIDDKKNKSSSSFFFGLKDNIKKINKSIKDKKQSIVINIKHQKKKIIKMINHKKENEKEIVINFAKPKNFEKIEKQWNYAKILLDNNIIDCTSKKLFIIYLFFYFYSNL